MIDCACLWFVREDGRSQSKYNKMKTYIGIDPGKGGGLAMIVDYKIAAISPMPLSGDNMIDGLLIAEWIKTQRVNWDDVLACVEKVSAMPGQGVKSMFTFGYGVGVIHGTLSTMGIPYVLVTPQAWKKDILAGTLKDKNAAVEYCTRMYPYVSLIQPRCKKANDGIAEAICIAVYASHIYR